MRRPLPTDRQRRWRLLRLLSNKRHAGQQGICIVSAGVVAAMVLILSGAAVVMLTSSNLRGVFASSDSRQARATAVEGSDLMIDNWNQPQNRRVLVSGADPGGLDPHHCLAHPLF
ncbi:MAG: hypothetical protein VKO00_04190 [Cyanobacteriota bacterium]|nr:hypothetical protein [Cyanobacteriota bacterium]